MEALKLIEIEIEKIENMPIVTIEGNKSLCNLKAIRETLLMIRGY